LYAESNSRSLPAVTTADVTIVNNNIISGGNVIDEGDSPVIARGICYGSLPSPDLSATYTHTENGTGGGIFTSQIAASVSGTIYVRAYATNANGTAYGNQITVDVDYLRLPTFFYNDRIYKVAPDPQPSYSQYFRYGLALSYCENLIDYGYSDWRLPTLGELESMYINRESIGGFVQGNSSHTILYWSSTNWSGGGHCLINWSNGQSDASYTYDNYGYSSPYYCHVRPIRVETNTITVSSNPSNGGSVSGGGEYQQGQSCTVQATANTGYTFTNWTENGIVVSTNASYTFTVSSNRTLVANFSAQSYTISVSANPISGGTVSGGGSFNYGQSCTLTATPAANYTFVKWTKNGTQVSNNATYTFNVTESATYVAHFASNVYTVTATANPTYGGTVICNKALISENFENYTTGNKIATEAHAMGHEYWTTWNNLPGGSEDGYVESLNGNQCGHFTYGNDQIFLLGGVSSGVYDIKIDILVPQGKNGYFNILHHFDGSNHDNCTWAMQCYLHITNDGQTSTSAPGHGTVHAGSNGTCDLPCVYDQWMRFRIHVDTDNDLAQLYFNVLGQPENMYAEWQWSLDSFGNNVSNNVLDAIDFFPPENAATSEFYVDNIVVSEQANNYFDGEICSLTATPNPSYTFANWTENSSVVSTNANYTFTVNANRNLVANFSEQSYTISVSANPSNGGTVTGGGTVSQGQSCTVNATANSGYTFTNWTENGAVVSTSANYTFTVTGNRTLVANFSTSAYAITATANPTNGGSVTGAGNYEHGTSCTLTAIANEGYTFVEWTKNGTQVSTNASYTFNVTSSEAYVAHFSLNSYTITATANPSAGGTVSGGGTFNYGQTCTVTASANNGYTFTNWTENGNLVSTNTSYTFAVTGNRTLVANFSTNAYAITATANPTNGGTVTGAGNYEHASSCTLTATPNEGYTFVKWTKNGTQVSTNASYTFTVTSSAAYVAHFTIL
jgi:hypothetical protein